MTKALFRKLNSIESTIVFMTGVIVISLGHTGWGMFFVFLSLFMFYSLDSMIKRYEEEGYKFSDEYRSTYP